MLNKSVKWEDKKKILHILCGLLVILIAYIPNFQKGIYTGMDLSFHLNRIDSLAESLRNGIFPVKLHATRAFGYGYGVGFFYCNFFLYIPAILINLGMDLLLAYKLFLFLIYIAIFCTMFFSVMKITNDSDAAFWAASFYLFSSKIMGAVYITGALGEITAYIFIPLAIAGIYLVLVKNEYPYMLMIGFSGLILSHTISTFLVFVVCAGLVLAYSKKLFCSWEKIVHLILAVICVAFITVGFWLPMLEQMREQKLKVNYPWTMSVNSVETFSSIANGEMSLGWLITIVFILSIGGMIGLIIAKRPGTVKSALPFGCIASIMIFITTWRFFWHFMNNILKIRFLQFPYRLFSSITVLVLFFFSIIYQDSEWKKNIKKTVALLILCLGIYISYDTYSGYYLNNGYEEVENVVNGVYPGLGGGEEWLPVETDLSELVDATKAYDNEGNMYTGKKINGCNKFIFSADMSKEYYDVPCIWYKGFVAEDSQGKFLEIDKTRETGMLRIYISENRDCEETITVYYKGTLIQKIAYVGNVIGIGILIIYLLFCRKEVLKIKEDSDVRKAV